MVRWVLIDESAGAACGNGETLSPLALARMAEAVMMQINGELCAEHGGSITIRVGAGPTDIQVGERVYSFKPTLPQEGASAYHDSEGNGVPAAYCAVTTCGSLFGPDGIGVDLSHELGEVRGDEGCNQLADDGKGTLHMHELCDPVEVQTYTKTCADGTVVHVSNFVLGSWFIPGAPPPYDYMTQAGLPGAVSPPAPMTIAPGNGGNYQIVETAPTSGENEVFGLTVIGTPKKPEKVAHWSSRLSCRIAARSGAKVDPDATKQP